MEKQNTNENIQSKVLLIRMWEILRKADSDHPLSLEDIRRLLMEADRANGIEEDPQKDKYNLRLLRTNIKAINAALEGFSAEINVPDNPERAELLKRKQKKMARAAKKMNKAKESQTSDPVGKIIIGRGESKACLYYHKDAFTHDEMGFLYDAVKSQDCLTEERANEIHRKLKKLVGENDFEPWEKRAVQLPASNLAVSDTFDIIHKVEKAIKQQKRISFKYMKGAYDARGWMWEPGIQKLQDIDPIALYYKDGHYYLYGYNRLHKWEGRYNEIKKQIEWFDRGKEEYRTLQVDRMARVTILDEPSEHVAEREQFFKTWDAHEGRIPAFLPWTGEPSTSVLLRIPYRLMPDVRDKFGLSVLFSKSKKIRGRVLCTIDVSDVQELLKWVFGYGGDVEILKPASVRKEALTLLVKNQHMIVAQKKTPKDPT